MTKARLAWKATAVSIAMQGHLRSITVFHAGKDPDCQIGVYALMGSNMFMDPMPQEK